MKEKATFKTERLKDSDFLNKLLKEKTIVPMTAEEVNNSRLKAYPFAF